MKTIYLIRHGETDWNEVGRFQGKTNTQLSEKGRAQAQLLAGRMNSFDIDAVYSSKLDRAIDTARPFAKIKGLRVIPRDELIEIDFGRWEGLTEKEICEKYPDEYNNCRLNPLAKELRYGLSFDDVKQTVTTFIDECIYNSEYEKIAVVSHSMLIKTMIVCLLDFPPEMLRAFTLSNCSISVISLDGNRKILRKLNDNSHIGDY